MACLTTDHAAQQAIDQEIIELEQTIRSLRLKRNTYSAFNQLPSDILSLIFTAFKDEFYLITVEGHAKWTVILGVCSHWRDVLLDTPQFWSAIPLSHPSLVSTMVKHSKTVPIDLYCSFFRQDQWKSTFHDSAEAVMSHSARIQSLTLGFSEDDDDLECVAELLELAKGRDLASLRSVELDLQWAPLSAEALYLPAIITLGPEALLPWSQMSALSCLTLTEVLIPSDVPLLPSLTKLVVSCRSISRGLSFDWIITFLRQTPNIEDVHLSESIHSSEDDALDLPDPITPICLPRLRAIDIDAEDLLDIRLFDVLEIPASTRIRMICNNFYGDVVQRADVLPAIATLMSRLTPTEKYDGPSKLSLDIGDPLRFGLEAYTEGNEAPFLELDIPMDNPHLPLDDIFVIFSSEVQPTLVTELTVSDTFMEDVTAAKWLNILPLFENLKYLNFTFCPPSTVVSVLPHVENKSLEIIMLLSVPRSGKPSEGDSKVTLSTFEEFLQNRKAAGLPLPKIVIKNCKITRPEVDSLRIYVSVDWDGVEDDGEEGS